MSRPKRYIVERIEQAADDDLKVGDVVYQSMKPDYGLARDDSDNFGVTFVSVTRSHEGDYPFFTIPLRDLQLVVPE